MLLPLLPCCVAAWHWASGKSPCLCCPGPSWTNAYGKWEQSGKLCWLRPGKRSSSPFPGEYVLRFPELRHPDSLDCHWRMLSCELDDVLLRGSSGQRLWGPGPRHCCSLHGMSYPAHAIGPGWMRTWPWPLQLTHEMLSGQTVEYRRHFSTELACPILVDPWRRQHRDLH